MKTIAILGSSGHAKVGIDVVEKTGAYAIVGLIDSFGPGARAAWDIRF